MIEHGSDYRLDGSKKRTHDLSRSVLYVDNLRQPPNSCLGLCWSLNQLNLLEYFSHLMRKRSEIGRAHV